jgi:serine phosphatase RsbU (regulator of sigma subunit)
VTSLAAGRRLPLGIPGPAHEVAVEFLEPGDRLLFFSDGVTEARDSDGNEFGLARLLDLAERHVAARLPVAETLRRLSHAVLDHQRGVLQDDATLLLLEWTRDDPERNLP